MVDIMLNVFNSYDINKRIQFTFELENKNSLNFLDITVHRDDYGNIKTNWYQKEISSGRTLNYNSNQPIHQKRAIVYNLVDRGIILSDKIYHNENLQKIKNILKSNDYPIKFTNKYIKRRLQIIKNNKYELKSKNNNSKKYACAIKVHLPYKKHLYEKINKTFKQYNIHAVPNTFVNQSNLIIRSKSKIPRELQTNVVYKLNCNDCPANYIGETKRALYKRTKEHMDSRNNVIYKHCLDNVDHNFNFISPSILDKVKSIRKRKISEMIEISLHDNNINLQTDTYKLHDPYTTLIKKLKT